MSLDISRLESINETSNKIVARCPACAEVGQDKKGNHLVIFEDGRFSCIVFQGSSGHEHRKRIFSLVGIKKESNKVIETVAQPLLKENAKHFCRFQGDSNVSYPLRYGAFGTT